MKTITSKIIAWVFVMSGIIFSQHTFAACNVPTGQNTTAITSTSASLNWAAPSGGAQSYNVRFRVVSTTTWTTVNAITGLTYAASGLNSNSNYEWQVQSKCSGTQTSNWTSSSTFTTLIACNIPAGLSTTNITSTDATLNWNTVSGAQSYSVRYRVVGAPSWTSTTSSTNSTAISSLTANSNYEWQVQTNCGGSNNSAYSSSSTFSTLLPPCNVPAGLNSTSITAIEATLNWTAVSGAVGYNVQYRIVGNPSWTSAFSSTASVVVSSLTSSSNYEWQVQTNCGSSNLSAFSSSATFVTSPPPCNIPTGLYTLNVNSNSADLNWDADLSASDYNIQYRIVGAQAWLSSTSVNSSMTISSLLPASTYEWQVQTNCGNSNLSAFSVLKNFSTSPPSCTTPTGLNVTGVASTAATLNWIAILGVSSYNIQYRQVGSGSWATINSIKAVMDISSLTPASTYEWQVQSDCGNSDLSMFSGLQTFTLPNHAPPLNAVTAANGNPIPSDQSSWVMVFVSSGSTSVDEQIVHDWLVAHGCLK